MRWVSSSTVKIGFYETSFSMSSKLEMIDYHADRDVAGVFRFKLKIERYS